MIESRNSTGVLNPDFKYTRKYFQSFHFLFGYGKGTKRSDYFYFLILFENYLASLNAGIS